MNIWNPELDFGMEPYHHEQLNGFIRHVIRARSLGRETADRIIDLNATTDALIEPDIIATLPNADLRHGPVAQGLRTMEDFAMTDTVYLKFDDSFGFHAYRVIGDQGDWLIAQRVMPLKQYVKPSFAGLFSAAEYNFYSGDNDPTGEHGKSNTRAIYVNTELTRLLFQNGIGQYAEDTVLDNVKRTFRSSPYKYRLNRKDRRPL